MCTLSESEKKPYLRLLFSGTKVWQNEQSQAEKCVFTDLSSFVNPALPPKIDLLMLLVFFTCRHCYFPCLCPVQLPQRWTLATSEEGKPSCSSSTDGQHVFQITPSALSTLVLIFIETKNIQMHSPSSIFSAQLCHETCQQLQIQGLEKLHAFKVCWISNHHRVY